MLPLLIDHSVGYANLRRIRSLRAQLLDRAKNRQFPLQINVNHVYFVTSPGNVDTELFNLSIGSEMPRRSLTECASQELLAFQSREGAAP